MNSFHKPVLLKEVIDNLGVKPEGIYIDATIGGGGHTEEILKRNARVLGIDQDQEALDFINKRRDKIINSQNLTLVKGNFKDLDRIAHLHGFNKADGIIFDLGVSSHQIDSPSRGFSYQSKGPLDMRMDRDLSVKASDLINILTKGELYELFTKLGEEHNARRYSSRIYSARRIKKIETIDDLTDVLGLTNKSSFEKSKYLKKIFQALRIAVNDELNNLREALPKAVELLKKEGILEVISFHSMEDRIVKQAFLEFEKENLGIKLTDKPIIPSEKEKVENSRSRSAKLRIFKKII